MTKTCPKCSAENDFILCSSCNSLIDHEEISNYFHIYRTDGKLAINAASLEADYFDLMKIVHPDKFARKDAAQHALALRYAELVNNGFKTLHNPFKRAIYFAELNDLRESSDQIPSEVMADVFEIHELLEEKKLSSEQSEELEVFLNDFTTQQRSLRKELVALFEKFDSQSLIAQDIKNELNAILNKASYFTRLVDSMTEKLDENE